MKREFEYILLTLAVLAVLMIIVRREGFSNNYPSTYKDLLLDSFRPTETNEYKLQNHEQQVKNLPKSEMSSYKQVSNNIPPNLMTSPCSGNEPFPSMCSTLYSSY